MLGFFRNNSPFAVIVLFILTLVFKVQSLMHPLMPVMVKDHYLYNSILHWLTGFVGLKAFSFTFLAIVLTFVQGLYINSISQRHRLFPRNTYLPLFLFLVLSSINPQFNSFNETIIINWFLLGALDIMFSFSQTQQPRKMIFNAAMLISLAVLFQFTMLGFLFLLMVGMVMFRPFSLGEWAIAFMGYLTPLYFLWCILFLFDLFPLFHNWFHIGFSVSSHLMPSRNLIILLSGLFILLGGGVFAMQKNVALSNIYVRRDWIALSFYLIISVIVAFITDLGVSSAWMIAIPPLSIIAAHSLALEKNRIFSNFMFYFALALLGYCLWVNK